MLLLLQEYDRSMLFKHGPIKTSLALLRSLNFIHITLKIMFPPQRVGISSLLQIPAG